MIVKTKEIFKGSRKKMKTKGKTLNNRKKDSMKKKGRYQKSGRIRGWLLIFLFRKSPF